MATVTHAGTAVWTTTAGNKTLTATPALNDLIVVVAATSGVAGGTTAVSDNNTDGLGAYTKIGSDFTGFSTTGHLSVWVRNALVGSASSTVFTATQASSTGGGLDVFRVSGMTFTGSSAVRSSGGQSTGTAATTPAPVLSLTPLTGNPIITAVCNGTSPGGVTGPASYTAPTNLGYSTPTAGLDTAFISSGITNATITWGSTSATAFASVAVELDTSVPVTFGPPVGNSVSQPAGARVSLVRAGLAMATLLPMVVSVPPTSGPPAAPRPGPVAIRKVLPPRGSVYRRAGTFQGTGPPAPPLRSPVGPGGDSPSTGTQPSRLPPIGRVYGISHAGTYGGTGPPVPALHSPVQAADSAAAEGQHLRLPARGTIVRGNPGTRGNLGPPARPLVTPVRASWPATIKAGQIRHLAGVYAGTGPAPRPLASPVRTPIPQRTRGGAIARRAGTLATLGPPVTPLRGPVRAAAARALPRRGRITAAPVTAVTTAVNVIAVYGAIPGPVRAALPATPPGRHTASPVKASTIITSGPPVTPLSKPVRASWPPRPRGGTAQHLTGTRSGTGPPPAPLREPVRAPVPARTRGGTALTRPGAYAGTGPALRPLTGPVRASIPARTRGGTARHQAGTLGVSGPPVAPLHHPVRAAQTQVPALTGRAMAIGPIPAPATFIPVAGPPIPARAQPWQAVVRPLPRRGTVTRNAGIRAGTGPALRPASSPVRAAWRARTHGGTVTFRHGVYTATAPTSGPPVAPRTQPVRAPVPQRTLGGTVRHQAGTRQGTGPAVPRLAQPASIRVVYARTGHVQRSPVTAAPPPPASGPPIPPRGQPWRAALPPPRVHGFALAMAAIPAPASTTPASGPAIRPRAGPWRAPIAARTRGGRARSNAGTSSTSGPAVAPLHQPVRAAWPARTRGGQVRSSRPTAGTAHQAATVLSGTGTLTGSWILGPSAVLSGQGTLTGTPARTLAAAAILSGTGTLAGTGQVIAPTPFTGLWTASPLPTRWQAAPLPTRWRVTQMQFTPIAAISVEYLPVNWTGDLAGTEGTDPTGMTPGQNALPVQFAVPVSSGNPLAPAEPVTWYAAVWLTGTNIRGYVAQCAVGPTGGSPAGLVQLTAGMQYDLWSRILGTPEQPTKFVGTIGVY